MANDGHPVLAGPMRFQLRDGSLYEIRPGPYGKGVAVHAVEGRKKATGVRGKDGRGRPPKKTTLQLRAKMASDAKAGRLAPAGDYYRWLRARDKAATDVTVRQTVYRERRLCLADHPQAERKAVRRRKRR